MSPVASLVTTDRCSNVSMCLRISTKCFLFPRIVPLLYSVGNKTYYYYYELNSIPAWVSNYIHYNVWLKLLIHSQTVIKEKPAVMAIDSKAQLQSLNLDQFPISLDSNKIEFANQAKYLGLLVKDDLSWDDHILQTCKTMNYYVHVLCRLNTIFPKQLLLKINKSYVQSKLDYGLSIWGCTTEGNLDRVQRIQNLCARIVCKNHDYINTRGIDIVDSLKIQETMHGLGQQY